MSVKTMQASTVRTGAKTSNFLERSAGDTSFDSIATSTIKSAGVDSISFDKIPQNYDMLQVRMFLLIEADADVCYRYNDDSTTNAYRQQNLYGNGNTSGEAASYDYGQSNLNRLAAPFQGFGSSGIPGSAILDIIDPFSSSKNKTSKAYMGINRNGPADSALSGITTFQTGLWVNTNPINKISIFTNTGYFHPGTHFALYGLRK